MRNLVIALVVAAAIVVGLRWTRSTPTTRTMPTTPTTRPPSSQQGAHTLTRTFPRASTTSTPRAYAIPAPAPTDSPARRTSQNALWGELRDFADATDLTDDQWNHLVQDLTELGEMNARAWGSASTDGDFKDAIELTDTLERELRTRCEAYMTPQQVAELHFRFSGLVTRVRQVVTPQLPQ